MGLAETSAREYVRARPMPLAEKRLSQPSRRGVAGLGLVLTGLLGVVATGLPACEPEPVKTALGYTDSAKHAYDLAMEQFNAHDWLRAENALREIKRKYSYSKYARLAELRLADLDFMQEKYPEAIHGYKDFIHAHRADSDDIAYARGKIAEAMCAQIPESALMPAQEERDQASVVDAYKELKSYIADYPEATETPRMRTLLGQITGRLVRHELYVARFYAHLDNFDAAIARIRYALSNYAIGAGPHGGATEAGDLEAQALLLLGETYMRLHKWTDARTAFQSILKSYSESALVVPARHYLASLSERGA
jgi:outer membrane protein assembly factor BamD